ncbi:MAG: PQQ-dependent sugar dehydrogenase [Sandaracinaceae bacterium]|nr:PQQ-dependent sugar dehydrogenase [Sandaracinaceae bacterium]
MISPSSREWRAPGPDPAPEPQGRAGGVHRRAALPEPQRRAASVWPRRHVVCGVWRRRLHGRPPRPRPEPQDRPWRHVAPGRRWRRPLRRPQRQPLCCHPRRLARALGLRPAQPLALLADPKGRLIIADVGQNKWEEVSIAERGDNLGWRVMEGRACYAPETGCDTAGKRAPIYVYGHDEGISITGAMSTRRRRPCALRALRLR